ncbi:MAG TPA: histidine kinase, partial [Candidatus Limnocylindrales bacterium]
MTAPARRLTADGGWSDVARWLLLVPPVAMAYAMVALGHDPTAADDPFPYLTDTLTGIVLTIAGLTLWSRRPGRPGGPLLVAAGWLWYVGDAYTVAPGGTLAPYLGFALHGLYDPILAFVVLSFPEDRLPGRAERWCVGAITAATILMAVWRLVATPPGFGSGYAPSDPASPLLLISDTDVALSGNLWIGLFEGLTMLALAALAVRRLVRLRPSARYVTTPVLVGGAVWAAVAAANDIAWFISQTYGLPNFTDWDLWGPIQYATRVLGPIGILIGAWRLRSRSSSVVEIVAGPLGAPQGSDLEGALRRAFDDPSLLLAHEDATGWTGTDGSLVDVDRLPPSRAVTILESPGAPSAAIIHDQVLLDDPALVRTLTSVVRLAVDNDRLQGDLRTQLEEVRASRARIVEAADAGRRRVERDLHDGAQQRLVALAVSLRTIRVRLGIGADPAVLAELDAAAAELRAAIDELRELARGLDPAILREAGLGPALQSLADRSPVPVRTDLQV